MIKKYLPNGQVLTFPEGTSQRVIKETMNRLSGEDDQKIVWSDEQLKSVVDQISDNFAKMDKLKSDHYEQLSEKYVETVEKSNTSLGKMIEKVLSLFTKSHEEKMSTLISKLDMSGFEKNSGKFVTEFSKISFNENSKEIARQIVNLANNMMVLISKIEKYSISFANSMDKNTAAIQDLSDTQRQNAKLMEELIAVLKAPKTIVHDANGKPQGIKIK